jgi:predicted transcriptional regulator of viral defense system
VKNISESIFYFISGHGRGWAFSSNDFAGRFARQQIDNALSDLAEAGKIRRVTRGLYDYPRFSDLLQKTLSPDIDQVAYAYARKFSWRIEVSGESALNLLGLSTQIPSQYVYLSDGPSKSYDIMSITLNFKKSSLKDIGFKHRESTLIVQALKALGKEHLTENVFTKIREQVDEKNTPRFCVIPKVAQVGFMRRLS